MTPEKRLPEEELSEQEPKRLKEDTGDDKDASEEVNEQNNEKEEKAPEGSSDASDAPASSDDNPKKVRLFNVNKFLSFSFLMNMQFRFISY